MDNTILSVLLIGVSNTVFNLLHTIKAEGLYPLEIHTISYDKKQAELYINEQKVDLIIIEISNNFPVWTFMDEIHSRETHIEILLTSHNKNFQYVYQAFQHHALNFLLEPIQKEILLHSLKEVYERIQMINKIKLGKKKLDLYELKQHQELMERILNNMLEKPIELEFLLREVNHRYKTNLCNENFQAIVINADNQELYYSKKNFIQRVLDIIENAFPYAHEVIGAIVVPYGITGIINFSPKFYLSDIELDIQNMYQNILALKKTYGDFEIAIGVGTIVHSMKDVNISLQEAFRAEQYKFVSNKKHIFYANNLVEKTGKLENLITIPQKKNFYRFLKNMDADGLTTWMDDIIEKSESYFITYPEGYMLLKDLIITMAKETWEDEKTEKYFMEEEVTLSRLNHIFDGRKILELTKKVILRICKKRKESQTNIISAPIQCALDYINQHYDEVVSLEELADLCYLSPNYFSSMFKEQVGETYIDYLTGFRLEQAIQLLTTTKKTVKEISNTIGYVDDKYFRKLFKNKLGLTPSQYRDRG